MSSDSRIRIVSTHASIPVTPTTTESAAVTQIKCSADVQGSMKNKSIKLLVDISGSMSGDIHVVKASLKTFLSLLLQKTREYDQKLLDGFIKMDDSVASTSTASTATSDNDLLYERFDIQIITFNHQATLIVDTRSTTERPDIFRAIDGIVCDGQTNIGSPLQLAVEKCRSDCCNWIVLFTDGCVNCGPIQTHAEFKRYIAELPSNIKINTCGYTTSHDVKLLRILGDYEYLTNTDEIQIPTVFASIAHEIFTAFGFNARIKLTVDVEDTSASSNSQPEKETTPPRDASSTTSFNCKLPFFSTSKPTSSPCCTPQPIQMPTFCGIPPQVRREQESQKSTSNAPKRTVEYILGSTNIGVLFQEREYQLLWRHTSNPKPDLTGTLTYMDVATMTPRTITITETPADQITITTDELITAWYNSLKAKYIQRLEDCNNSASVKKEIEDAIAKWPDTPEIDIIRKELRALMKRTNADEFSVECASLQSNVTRQCAYAAVNSLGIEQTTSVKRQAFQTDGAAYFASFMSGSKKK